MQQLPRNNELSLSDISKSDRGLLSSWDLLRGSLWAVLLATLLGGACGLLLTLWRTPIYQSHLKLEVQQANSNFLSMRDVSPSQPANEGPSPAFSYLETQVQILNTDALVEAVVRKIGPPPESQGQSAGVVEQLRASITGRAERVSELDTAISVARENLRVRSAQQGYVIEIEYDSVSPEYSARFASALGDAYIAENLQARWSAAQNTAEWLRKKLGDLKSEVESTETDLQTYTTKSGLLLTEDKHSIAEERLRQIQQELSTVQAERMSKEAQLNTALTAPPDSLPAVLDHGPMRELQLKQTELRRQLAEMSSLLTPTNYKVERVQAQIDELEKALKSERSRVIERLKNEFETSKHRQELLTTAYNQQAHNVTEQAQLRIRYETLKHNAESSRALYADLLQKVKTVGLVSAIPASNVRIIEPAKVPLAPYKPVPLLGLAVGSLAGFVLSAGVVALRSLTKGGLSRPGDASLGLGVKELGAMPSARISAPELHQARRLPAPSTAVGSIPNRVRRSFAGEQSVLLNPEIEHGMLVDSLQAITASLLFSFGQTSTAVVITSPRANEGKTTISSHLAVNLAETGRRVLLVDGDMRAPRLHNIFGLPNEFGLGNLMAARLTNGKLDPLAFANKTSVPGLHVLTSGIWPNSSALFQESLVGRMFEEFRNSFDVTLIDTPPMLLTPVARLLGRSADAVVLVLRAGKTSLETAQLCQQNLEHDGANLLGTILNDWSPEPSVYQYYSTKP